MEQEFRVFPNVKEFSREISVGEAIDFYIKHGTFVEYSPAFYDSFFSLSAHVTKMNQENRRGVGGEDPLVLKINGKKVIYCEERPSLDNIWILDI